MAYKLVITDRADELLEKLVYHLIFRLKNKQAAKHLLDGVAKVYDRLESNPRQFPISSDAFLAKRGYHEAVVPQMDYVIVFDIRSDVVNIVGIFHQSENYPQKL